MFKLFSTRLSMVQLAAFLAATSSAFILSACAGGVGEETNSIVGAAPDEEKISNNLPDTLTIRDSVALLPEDGAPQIGDVTAPVSEPSDGGELSDNVPSIESPNDNDFYGKLYNNNGQILNISVMLPEGTRETTTDSLGFFTLNNLPDGTFPMLVSKGNTGDIAYLVQKGSDGKNILGPVSASAVTSLDASSFDAPPVETIYYDGEADEQPTAGADPSVDSSALNMGGIDGHSGYIVEPVNGLLISAVAINELPNDIDYGIVKHWSSGIKNGSTEAAQTGIAAENAKWSVEVKFQLNSVDAENNYIKNIFGQFGDEGSYFSLALINGECGTTAPSLAFFVGDQNEFSCYSAVVSAASVEVGKPLSVTVSVNNGILKLYKNGFLIASNFANYYMQSKSEGYPPFVFGESDFDVKLNDVRLGEKAINSADVLYRYYQ